MSEPQNIGRIVLTGASGFLGRAFCREWGDRLEITGTGKSNPPAEGCRPAHLDLADFDSLPSFMDTVRPEAVVHCAALSKPDYCQQHPEESELINAAAPVRLAELCAVRSIRFLFVSTDLVFDGDHAPYNEEATPAPLSEYGRHKVLAEQGVMAAHPQAVVCRMPIMYGLGEPHAPSFLDWMLAAVREGRPLRLFTDETRSFASVRDAAQGLGLVLQSGESGIFHLGGPERLTRYELGEIFNAILCDRSSGGTFQGKTAIIEPSLRADVDTPAPRPADVSLISSRAEALGYAPETVRQGLARILRKVSNR